MTNHESEITNSIISIIYILHTNKHTVYTRWYNIRDYQRAAKAYSQATKLADSYFNQPSKDKIATATSLEEKAQAIEESYQGSVRGEDEEVVGVYMVCLNNLIAVQMSLKNYLKAKELCVKLLEIDPRNVKGLIRAAKVSLALDVSLPLPPP
ncbi:hypothetical protein EON64_14465, partial [archaeon]